MSAAEYRARFGGERFSNAFTVSDPARAEIPFSAIADKKTTGAEPQKTLQSEVKAPAAQGPLPAAPISDSVEKAEQEDKAPTLPREEWRVIGEVFRMYILVEAGDTLLLIDKHAAHERVIFEDLLKNLKATARSAQSLIVPMELSVSSEDGETLAAFEKEIGAVGFSFAVKGNKVLAFEIPDGLTTSEAGELLLTLAAQLREGEGKAELSRDILFEKALYQGACKAAMKGGRDYPPEYVAWLCERLRETEDITVCPHGRPIAVKLTRAMLDRRFGRT